MTVRNQRHSIVSTQDANYVTPVENDTLPLVLYFIQVAATTTAASPASEDTRVLVVTSATGATVGGKLIVTSPSQNRLSDANIVAIAGTSITVDIPFEYDVEAGDIVVFATQDLDVDGSGTTQVFSIPNLGAAYQSPNLVLTRVIIQITTASAVDFAKFGDITGGLTNGIVLRKNNDIISNIWNTKTNADIALIADDYTPYDASNPGQGSYGLSAVYGLGGMDKHGTAIRLEVGEAIELLIQDDLTSLESFRMMAQGHLEPLR